MLWLSGGAQTSSGTAGPAAAPGQRVCRGISVCRCAGWGLCELWIGWPPGPRPSLGKAAVAFLLGERDFTDAEQRCAMQSKQAGCGFKQLPVSTFMSYNHDFD